jgi:hypothetical protein
MMSNQATTGQENYHNIVVTLPTFKMSTGHPMAATKCAAKRHAILKLTTCVIRNRQEKTKTNIRGKPVRKLFA